MLGSCRCNALSRYLGSPVQVSWSPVLGKVTVRLVWESTRAGGPKWSIAAPSTIPLKQEESTS